MDNAVSLVRAYLHMNGYFTVTEYPILETARHGGYRTVTDIDILALRFARVGRISGRETHPALVTTDPMLHEPGKGVDMIIGEVKEGSARMNPNAHDPDVLSAALIRFGCCLPEESSRVVRQLLAHGTASMSTGHTIRMMVFAGGEVSESPHPWLVVPLSHVIDHLIAYLDKNWDIAHHVQFKDDALAFLALQRKAELQRRRISENQK